jgi:hypothetical protein
MKKNVLLIVLLFIIHLSIKAQGNLEYNRVVLVTLSGLYYQPVDTIFTIPTGKVWKIESAMAGNIEYPGFTHMLYLNGKMFFASNSSYGGIFPIWLPAGTYTLSAICAQGASNYTNGSISAIEYNEVP